MLITRQQPALMILWLSGCLFTLLLLFITCFFVFSIKYDWWLIYDKRCGIDSHQSPTVARSTQSVICRPVVSLTNIGRRIWSPLTGRDFRGTIATDAVIQAALKPRRARRADFCAPENTIMLSTVCVHLSSIIDARNLVSLWRLDELGEQSQPRCAIASSLQTDWLTFPPSCMIYRTLRASSSSLWNWFTRSVAWPGDGDQISLRQSDADKGRGKRWRDRAPANVANASNFWLSSVTTWT